MSLISKIDIENWMDVDRPLTLTPTKLKSNTVVSMPSK
jgi:hypothetical protein